MNHNHNAALLRTTKICTTTQMYTYAAFLQAQALPAHWRRSQSMWMYLLLQFLQELLYNYHNDKKLNWISWGQVRGLQPFQIYFSLYDRTLLWLLMEPYNYHVLRPIKEPVPLVALTFVVTNHIKLSGGWSFVSKLQQHPLIIRIHHKQRFTVKMYLSKIIRASDHPYLYGKGGRFVSFTNSITFMFAVFSWWLEHIFLFRPTMRWLTWGWHFLVTRKVSGPCSSLAVLEPDSPCGIWKGMKRNKRPAIWLNKSALISTIWVRCGCIRQKALPCIYFFQARHSYNWCELEKV